MFIKWFQKKSFTLKINGKNKTYYRKWSKIKTVKTNYIEKRLDFSSLFCYNIPAFVEIQANTHTHELSLR